MAFSETPEFIGGKHAQLSGQDSAYDKAVVGGVTQGNHGTLEGGATFSRSSVPPVVGRGQSLQCNGTDAAANCGNTPAFGTNDFTVAAWINRATNSDGAICSRGIFGAGQWSFRIAAGFLQWTDAISSMTAAAPAPLAWSHVVVRRVGSDMDMFINGAQVQTVDKQTDYNTSLDFKIGTDTTPSWFNGWIDELRTYGRGLSDQEVANLAIYPPDSTQIPTDTTAYYDFDDNLITDAPAGAPAGAKSMLFDGTEDTTSAGIGILNLGTKDRTIEGWVKTSMPNPAGAIGLFGTDQSAGIARHACRMDTSGRIQLIFDADGIAASQVESGTTINDGQWHHVAGTFDRDGNMVAWNDGTASAGENISAHAATDIVTVAPWGTRQLSSRFFKGQSLGWNVYDRVLTSTEINQRRQHVEVPGVVARWQYDQTRNANTWQIGAWDQTLRDQVGSAHGTLTNFPSEPNTGWVEARPAQFEDGWSLRFDGTDDEINLSFGGILAPPETYSIWVNPGDISQRGFWAHTAPSVGYIELLNSTQLRTRFRNNILTWTFPGFEVGRWYNVIVQRAADGMMRAWVDNIEASEGEQDSGGTTAVTMEFLGRGSTSGAQWWQGLLSDARIYNRILSDQERATVAAGDRSQPPQVSSGLLAYYDFRDARHYSGPDTFAADLGTTARFPAGAAAAGVLWPEEEFATSATVNAGGQCESVTFQGSSQAATLSANGRAILASGLDVPDSITLADLTISGKNHTSTFHMLEFSANSTAYILRRCICRDDLAQNASGFFLLCQQSTRVLTVHNCFFQNLTGTGAYTAIGNDSSAAGDILNVSMQNVDALSGNAVGISIRDEAAKRVQNCAVIDMQASGGTSQCFNIAAPVNAVMDHNASGDGTASGTGSLTNVAAEDCFIGPENNGALDLHTFPGSALQDVGTDLSGLDILQIFLDIDRDNRNTGTRDQQVFTIQPFPLAVSAAWDIGADEWVTGQPTGQAGLGAISRRRRLAGARR